MYGIIWVSFHGIFIDSNRLHEIMSNKHEQVYGHLGITGVQNHSSSWCVQSITVSQVFKMSTHVTEFKHLNWPGQERLYCMIIHQFLPGSPTYYYICNAMGYNSILGIWSICHYKGTSHMKASDDHLHANVLEINLLLLQHSLAFLEKNDPIFIGGGYEPQWLPEHWFIINYGLSIMDCCTKNDEWSCLVFYGMT